MSKQHFDILIIGAGLSGIGTACHIANQFPNKKMAILERRERIGGTWDLFRYPGIRSDSDALSFSYKFRPWTSRKVLASGQSIRQYIQDTAEEHGIKDKVHYGLQIIHADWSNQNRCWHLTALHEKTGKKRQYTCKFLVGCTGYYNHDAGFRPTFPGEDNFKGIKIHPQQWPEDLDYTGKKVVVIGSGATAVTLVPSMAGKAGHVTMLQRSPSYIYSLPSEDNFTDVLSRFMPSQWAYSLVRKRNILINRATYLACRHWPKLMRRFLLSHVRKQIGPSIDMRHFTPKYMPWDERLCAVPDGDLFRELREGRASIETDHIQSFVENGILLKSGKVLEADIIITATGLKLQMLGGMALSVDGQPRQFSDQMIYKGVLVENTPNLAWIFGYTNAPWTLKVDIAAKYLCRLFQHMDQQGIDMAVPYDSQQSATDGGILDSLQSGYVQRDKHEMPRQGKRYPWKILMHYGRDKKMLLKDMIRDPLLQFYPARATLVKSPKDKSKAA